MEIIHIYVAMQFEDDEREGERGNINNCSEPNGKEFPILLNCNLNVVAIQMEINEFLFNARQSRCRVNEWI